MLDYSMELFPQGHSDQHLPRDRRPVLVQESWCGRKRVSGVGRRGSNNGATAETRPCAVFLGPTSLRGPRPYCCTFFSAFYLDIIFLYCHTHVVHVSCGCL